MNPTMTGIRFCIETRRKAKDAAEANSLLEKRAVPKGHHHSKHPGNGAQSYPPKRVIEGESLKQLPSQIDSIR